MMSPVCGSTYSFTRAPFLVQHHMEEFVRQFKWAISSRQIFKWQQATRPETLTDIQRVARFLYLQQHAFSDKATGQSFGTANTGPLINLCRIEENLSAACLRLGGTYVENLTWQDCMQRYNRPHRFLYLDPPYWQTEGYGVELGFEKYEQMAEVMRTCKGKAMLSINDHPDIRRVFNGFNMMGLDIKYSIANAHGQPATSKELVIMNWAADSLGQLF